MKTQKILFIILFSFLFLGFDLFSQTEINPILKFGVVADVQYDDKETQGTRNYRLSIDKLNKAVEVFNENEVDFVINLGDFIDGDYKNFDTLLSVTQNLNVDLHNVLGNHDFSIGDKEKKYVFKKLDNPQGYYSFVEENWKFIILNGMDISLIGNSENSKKSIKAKSILNKLSDEGAPNAKTWNGALGKEQLRWMDKEISKSFKEGQKVIISCHFPIYPEDSPHTLWNSSDVRSIIESYSNVVAFFNGHSHTSNYSKSNNIHHITFRGMVEKEASSFAIVNIYSNRIEIMGFDEEVSRRLDY